VGARLVAEAERVAAQLSVRELYLLTTTAEKFFAEHGYRIVALDPPFKDARGVIAPRLRRPYRLAEVWRAGSRAREGDPGSDTFAD